jgi:hypothetical protein
MGPELGQAAVKRSERIEKTAINGRSAIGAMARRAAEPNDTQPGPAAYLGHKNIQHTVRSKNLAGT